MSSLGRPSSTTPIANGGGPVSIDTLHDGTLDIVIGTHRLISDDVQFNDLGLVVVDEEQRFGVEHKQKLMRFRVTVDVLTLSATPIPRTMAMTFYGEPRDKHVYEHAKESPAVMTVPLMILAVLSTVGGFLGIPLFPKLNAMHNWLSRPTADLKEEIRSGKIQEVYKKLFELT